MKLDADELQQIADALAPLLVERLPQPTTAPEFVDRAAAARLAGIGSELWRRITHELDAYRIGNRVVVRHADLVAWIEARQLQRCNAVGAEPDGFQQLIEKGRLRRVK